VLGVGAAALPVVIHDSWMLGLPALLAAGLVGWLAIQPARPALALAAMILFTASLLGWELPHAAPLWLAPRIEQALVESGLADHPVAAVGFHEPSLMLLAGTDTVMSATGADGAQALAAGKAASAAISDRDEVSFHAEATKLGLNLRTLRVLPGFNYSRGRNTVMTLYALVKPAS
jgi:hypothetical protein